MRVRTDGMYFLLYMYSVWAQGQGTQTNVDGHGLEHAHPHDAFKQL